MGGPGDAVFMEPLLAGLICSSIQCHVYFAASVSIAEARNVVCSVMIRLKADKPLLVYQIACVVHATASETITIPKQYKNTIATLKRHERSANMTRTLKKENKTAGLAYPWQ